MAIFPAIFSGLCLLLFLHPYISFPLSLRMMRPRPLRPASDTPWPSASILFCAHNEERALPEKLGNLEAIRALHPDIRIFAYDDMSSDSTRTILMSRPDLLTLVPSRERTGKATGMRHMVEQADSDICIFTDANVIIHPRSIAPLLDCFRDPAVGGVSGQLRYINDKDGTTAQVGSHYWRLEEHIKTLESRCGSMMGADGAIFATRREIYPQVPPHLLDDMTVSTSVMFEGLRLVSGPGVIAYEKGTTDSRDEFRRKRRIACRAFNTHRYLWPAIRDHFPMRDIYKYVSHKLLRWLGAPIEALFLISFTATLLLTGHDRWVLILWAAGSVAMLLGRMGFPVFSVLYEIQLSIIATFIGVIDSLRGRTYQTWSPAKSRN